MTIVVGGGGGGGGVRGLCGSQLLSEDYWGGGRSVSFFISASERAGIICKLLGLLNRGIEITRSGWVITIAGRA